MEGIVDQILKWPVIVQGALGSGLFWLILIIGEKAFGISWSKFTSFNKQNRLDRLQAERIRYMAFIENDKSKSSFYLIGLIYMAAHNLVKALISACLVTKESKASQNG